MPEPHEQPALPFDPPIERTPSSPDPTADRELGLEQFTAVLFEEIARREAALPRERHANARPPR